jgi:hypothetical protein
MRRGPRDVTGPKAVERKYDRPIDVQQPTKEQ